MAAIQRPALPSARVTGGLPWRALLIAAAALVLGVALLQVNQFSAVTGTGYQIEDLRRERAAKQAANRDLEAEVARLSSLARVDIEARTRLGMTPAARVMQLQIAGDVPDRQTLPTRFLPAGAASAAADGPPLWKRLLDLLPH